MLIAIPIEQKKQGLKISQNFGRCDKCIFYHQDTGRRKLIANPYKSMIGGAGIQSAQLMIENKVDTVLTRQIGLGALIILSSADIKTFICPDDNCKTAIKLFLDNRLKEFSNKLVMQSS